MLTITLLTYFFLATFICGPHSFHIDFPHIAEKKGHQKLLIGIFQLHDPNASPPFTLAPN